MKIKLILSGISANGNGDEPLRLQVDRSINAETEPQLGDLLQMVSELIDSFTSHFNGKASEASVKVSDDEGRSILTYGKEFAEDRALEAVVDYYKQPQVPVSQPVVSNFDKIASAQTKQAPQEKFKHELLSMASDGSGATAIRAITESSNKTIKLHLERGDVLRLEAKRTMDSIGHIEPHNRGEITMPFFYILESTSQQAFEEGMRTFEVNGVALEGHENLGASVLINEGELDQLLTECETWKVHTQ